MSPTKHVISGIVLGGIIYIATREVGASITAVPAAVLCDVDHVLEYSIYCINNKEKPNFNCFFSGHYFEIKDKMYILFHAYEYLIIGMIATLLSFALSWEVRMYFLSITLGYATHMLLDTVGNHCRISAYFILFRIMKRWNIHSFDNK